LTEILRDFLQFSQTNAGRPRPLSSIFLGIIIPHTSVRTYRRLSCLRRLIGCDAVRSARSLLKFWKIVISASTMIEEQSTRAETSRALI
jgi:hypothetical protein